MLLITHLLLGLLVCHVLICSPPPTKAFTATGDIKKKLGALRKVTIKLVQPAAGNAQQQETNVIASIRGDGTLALAYAAGNLVQNMTLNPGQNPDRVACAILRYLRREEDDVADAATTSETSDPLSCWRYDDEKVMPFAAGPTQHQWTHSEAANTVIFVPQSHDMLLELHARLGVSLTHLRDYPRTAAEWPAQYQHLLGKLTKFDDATTLPPQSTWVLPTLQLDAARAFTVLDFCKWARSYKFERPRRLLVTDSNDPELRCLQQPSDRTVLLAFDKLTGSGDFHRPLPVQGMDLIVVSQTLEHLHTPALALSHMFRALSPGGFLFTSVPFINKLHDGVPLESPPYLHHFTHYTPFGLAVAAATIGFEVLELGSWGNRDYVKNILIDHFPGVDLWPSLRENRNFANNPLAPAQAWILAHRPPATQT